MAGPRRQRSVFVPFTVARRKFIMNGLLGGSRKWLIIGGIVYVGGALRRTFGKNPEIVLIERLLPGQPIRLEAIAAPTRRERRAARRK
jgi:hypothetical protein